MRIASFPLPPEGSASRRVAALLNALDSEWDRAVAAVVLDWAEEHGLHDFSALLGDKLAGADVSTSDVRVVVGKVRRLCGLDSYSHRHRRSPSEPARSILTVETEVTLDSTYVVSVLRKSGGLYRTLRFTSNDSVELLRRTPSDIALESDSSRDAAHVRTSAHGLLRAVRIVLPRPISSAHTYSIGIDNTTDFPLLLTASDLERGVIVVPAHRGILHAYDHGRVTFGGVKGRSRKSRSSTTSPSEPTGPTGATGLTGE